MIRTEHHPRSPLVFRYRNHRGEVATRTVTGAYLWFGKTDWYPEPQWMIRGHDVEKADYRDFAVKNIIAFGTAAPGGITWIDS